MGNILISQAEHPQEENYRCRYGRPPPKTADLRKHRENFVFIKQYPKDNDHQILIEISAVFIVDLPFEETYDQKNGNDREPLKFCNNKIYAREQHYDQEQHAYIPAADKSRSTEIIRQIEKVQYPDVDRAGIILNDRQRRSAQIYYQDHDIIYPHGDIQQSQPF